MGASGSVQRDLKTQGNSAFKAGRYEEAVLLYARALRSDERDGKLWSNRSAAFMALNKPCLAFEDAQRAVALLQSG